MRGRRFRHRDRTDAALGGASVYRLWSQGCFSGVGSWGSAEGATPPYSHSIVPGGFEVTS